MMGVTVRALEALYKLRAAEGASVEQALGLVPEAAGRVGFVLDVPGPGARVYSRRGEPILFVDAALIKRLADRVLDHAGPPGQERFTLDRATATAAPPHDGDGEEGARPAGARCVAPDPLVARR